MGYDPKCPLGSKGYLEHLHVGLYLKHLRYFSVTHMQSNQLELQQIKTYFST